MKPNMPSETINHARQLFTAAFASAANLDRLTEAEQTELFTIAAEISIRAAKAFTAAAEKNTDKQDLCG